MSAIVRSNKRPFFLFLLPGLLIYVFIYIYPMLNGVFYSFTNWNGFGRTFSMVGLTNYLKTFTNMRFYRSLWFTLKYTFFLTVLANGLGLILALILNRELRGKIFFRAMYFFPAILSMVTAGLIWNEIFYRIVPLFGEAIGSEALSSNILGNAKLALYGILWVHIWQYTPQAFVLILAGLQAIPSMVTEAARIDGASPWQVFRYITVPYLIPIFEIVIVLTIKYGFVIFDYIIAMTNGGPGGATESLSVLIYKLGFNEARFSAGCAMSVIMFIIIVALSFSQLSLLREREVIQ
ncbi:MAG: sugar ABC transporter permease [Spirochaetales bacterium]|nr:sugar ABC transporter permease [Spirochaetales bacterium]